MDVKLTRLADDGTPNTLRIEMPEGRIAIRGTPGFVTGTFRALLAPGSVVRALIVEHTDPDELMQTWHQAMRDAGVEPSI